MVAATGIPGRESVTAVTDLVGVVLAAGAGTRLRPLTDVRPKALCTVGGRPLLDLALDRVVPHAGRTAVNAHHHADQLLAALAGRDVHVSRRAARGAGHGRRPGPAAGLGRRRRRAADQRRRLLPRRRRRSASCWPAGTANGPGCSASAAPTAGDFGDLRYVGAAAAAVVVGA